ncbi:MAG: DUF1043 family protein, partial [Porticoccus sp.]|nr:DUF1043 family protein [Porticoccus sp.]
MPQTPASFRLWLLYLETTFHGVHDLTTTTLLIGLIFLAVGLIVGFVFARTLHPQARERKDLEDQLQKSQDQLKDYQQEVTE